MPILPVLTIVFPFPLISFFLAWYGFVKNPSKWRRYLFMYVYAIFVFSYSYVPISTSNLDLVRYLNQIERLQGYSLKDTILFMNDSLFFENFLFWLVARTRLPHLLPAFTTSMVYGIGAYIACDFAEAEDKNNTWIVILVQFILIPYVSTLSNIRNVFAFSLVILAAYREQMRKKHNLLTLVLYILPVFMHKTGIILIAIRMLIPLFKRFQKFALTIIIGLPLIINILYKNIHYITIGGLVGRIIRRVILSAYSYLQGETAYAERIRNSLGALLSRYIVFAFLLILLVFYLVYFRKNKKVNDFYIMGYLVCIFTLSCNAIDTPAYWRFSVAEYLAVPPLLYQFYKSNVFIRRYTYYIKNVLLAYYSGRVLFTLIRFTLPEINESLYLLLTTNIYTLVVQIIRNIFIY